MAFDWVELVRLLHVVSAAIWVGGAVFALLIVGPAVRAAGPAGQAFMQAVGKRGGPARIMMPLSVVTIVSGLILYWQRRYFDDPFGSVPSAVLTIGAALGLLIFLIGITVGMPMQRRMAAMAKEFGPSGPTPEQQATMANMGATMQKMGTRSSWGLVVVILLMVGRNLFGF